MPQMMPMNWLLIMIFVIFILFFFNIYMYWNLNYFFKMKNINFKMIIDNNKYWLLKW